MKENSSSESPELTDNIIEIINTLKKDQEDLEKSRRCIDSISNQNLILKKKYIEPYEKLKKSIVNKQNLDGTNELYEKVKIFKENIKIVKLYTEKESLMLESGNFFNSFKYVKNCVTENTELKDIEIIKPDFDWFQTNEEKILNFYRIRFQEAIKNKDNTQISKYLDYLSNLSQSLLINEIKNYSNKLLKDIMIERFFKRIVQGQINTINQLDWISENVQKTRIELKRFFAELSEWSEVMLNLGELLRRDFDKNNLMPFDEIMNLEGLKGIYDLFIDKIQSSFSQIFDKLKTNSKLANSFFYFNKDFLFFYFTLRSYLNKFGEAASSNIRDDKLEFIQILKISFFEKFESAIGENFTRACNLIKNVEKNADSLGKFDKENIVNVQIIDHLVKYIKNMSMSFVDLNDEFPESLIENDSILIKIKNDFSKLLHENYLFLIYTKLDNLLSLLNDPLSVSVLYFQKFYFFYYILYKMNEVFISFLNSNIPFLITEEIQLNLEEKMGIYMQAYYKVYLMRLGKETKIFLMNKDIVSLNSLLDNLKTYMKLFFDSSYYNNNKCFEKYISKISIFTYSYIMTLIIIGLNSKYCNNLETMQNLINIIDEFCGIFFTFRSVSILNDLHEYITKILFLDSNELNERAKSEKTLLFKFLLNLRSLSINENRVLNFLKSHKLNMDIMVLCSTIIIMNYLKITTSEFKFHENQVSIIENIRKTVIS